jgi:glycogen synthase kinase 3 beta
LGITHRDIKPENLLVNPVTRELKIADFGSAKQLKPDEKSISYIATRSYRAPELLLDCENYTSAIDIWAAACVIAETINAGTPIFNGRVRSSQITEIMKVMGPPTSEDLDSIFRRESRKKRDSFRACEQSVTLEHVLPNHTTSEFFDLMRKMLRYDPNKRLTAVQCLCHECFNELFSEERKTFYGRGLPPLERPKIL